MPRAASITPETLRKNGGVAIRIREAMQRKGMDIHALNKAIGFKRGSTTPYTWIKARGFPAKSLQPKLAKALDLTVDDLQPNTSEGPQRALVPVINRVSTPRLKPVKDEELWSFHMMADGSCNIRLGQGMPSAAKLAMLGGLMHRGKV